MEIYFQASKSGDYRQNNFYIMSLGEQKDRGDPTVQRSSMQKKSDNSSNQTENSDPDSDKLYRKIMDKVKCDDANSYAVKRLTINKIKYNQDMPADYELHTQILRSTYNFQAVLLRISYCRFQTEISLLNIPGHFQFDGTLLGSGTYGDVYAYKNNNYEVFAIKIIRQNKFHLQKILKQYFLNLIMSALECGPKIFKCFGFDVLLFESSALFSMELCSSINQFSENNGEYLYQKLKLIHSLNIIHGDIKPENIVFSNFLKKPVFCDFGLTRQIPQKIGEKSATFFFGSYSYASPQMFRLIYKNLYGDVNLYYNDVYALQITFKQMCYTSVNQKLSMNMLSKSKVFDYCQANYLIFMKQYHLINEIKHQKQFLSFLILMEPSQQLYTLLARNFSYKEDYKILFQKLTLVREIYTERGISIKKWQQFKIKCQINFQHRLLNIQKPYKAPQNQLKIQAIEGFIENPNLKFNELCQYTVEYLALWRDDSWNNAQTIIEKLFSKYPIKQDAIKSTFKIASKEQTVIFKSDHKGREIKLFLILEFLYRKYQKQNNLTYQSKIFDLMSNFFVFDQHLKIRFQILQKMIKSEEFDQAAIFNQTISFMTLGIMPIPFQFVLEKFLYYLEMIKTLLGQCLLRNYLQLCQTVLKFQGSQQRKKENLENLLAILNQPNQNHKFAKLLLVSKLCLKARFQLFTYRYKQVINVLETIESELDQIHYDCRKFIKKFVMYCFIVVYTNLKNQRGQMLAIQQIKRPKSFEKLWDSANQQILIYKHCITHKWVFFCEQVSKYLHSKSYNCFQKMRLCIKFLTQMGMFIDEFYETLSTILNECFEILKNLSESQILENVNYFKPVVLQLLVLYHKIFLKNKKMVQKQIKQLEQFFFTWLHFGLELQRQIGKFIGLKIIFLFSERKFAEAILYYEQHKHIKIRPNEQIYCLFYVGMCHGQLNLSQTTAYCTQAYDILRKKDEHFLLSSSSYFINILQNYFYGKQMLEQYIELFGIILQQIYLNKFVSKPTLKYFIQECIFRFPKYAVATLDHFLLKKFYYKKNIEYHNCSALLIQAMYHLNYMQNSRLVMLRRIAMTLNFLQAKIILMIKPKYYLLMLSCVQKRKKAWLLQRTQTRKQKLMKKNLLIKRIQKQR